MAALDTEDQRTGAHSRTLDISESGVGGLFHESWEVGSRVRLEVSLPVEQTPLKIGAIVRHHAGVRYGFEFIDISLEQRRMLRNACKVLSKGPGS
jgi:c-di-GMP-binding flagellar brake protein YcgR